VPGDGSGIESEQKCTDACRGSDGSITAGLSCVWTAATASSPYQCEYIISAMQERSPMTTIEPQGGGTACPEDERRSCKLDVSVYLFFLR